MEEWLEEEALWPVERCEEDQSEVAAACEEVAEASPGEARGEAAGGAAGGASADSPSPENNWTTSWMPTCPRPKGTWTPSWTPTWPRQTRTAWSDPEGRRESM